MDWRDRTRKQAIGVGDKVAYRASFLRSISCYTGDMPHARGVVAALVPLGETTLAEIDWGNPDLLGRVNVANLSRVTERGILYR